MTALSRAQVLTDRILLGQRGGVRLERGEWRERAVFAKTLAISDPDFQVRFHHEGRVALRLHHPQIVPLLAHTREQLLFEFIEGCSLRERLDRGPLSVPEALSAVRGVLLALRHAHELGIVHHDLKPENVMLCGGQPDEACVRLTDFGMAHDRSLPEDLHAGTRMGTPQFMAPEQFRGLRGDARSDLYSAGALLFDCLAGQPPHQDALGWLVGLSSERLPLPGPAALHALMEAALERDPVRRPQSAEAMLRQLDAAQGALPEPLSGRCA